MYVRESSAAMYVRERAIGMYVRESSAAMYVRERAIGMFVREGAAAMPMAPSLSERLRL